MGIRFTCPNGHKLNVKSNLAGRRGWCPHCGVPVEIPLQSTRESSHTKRREGAVEPPESLSNVQKSPATQSESTVAEGQSASKGAAHPTPTSSMPARTVGYGEEPSATANASSSAAGIQSAAMASVEAVLNERPSAVWYLHQGESQRGPFLMDSMREFFQNGQIESEAIVWREDWPDWRDVTEVFPALFPMSAPIPTNSTAASSVAPTPVASAAQDFLQNTIQGERRLASPGMAQTSKAGKKKSLPINGVTALCIFAVSLLMLGIGACWMLTHNGGDAENVGKEPTSEVLTAPTKSVTPTASEENTAPLTDAPTVTDTSTTVSADMESTTTK